MKRTQTSLAWIWLGDKFKREEHEERNHKKGTTFVEFAYSCSLYRNHYCGTTISNDRATGVQVSVGVGEAPAAEGGREARAP